MRSAEKMKVIVKPMNGKSWVEVRFLRKGKSWIPSFEDLFRIIQAICHCEDEKYLPPNKGRDMVKEFLSDCCQKGVDWNWLAEEYKIPLRGTEW